MVNNLRTNTRKFYTDGINRSTRRAYGRFVFSSQGQVTWGNSVLDPVSMATGLVPVEDKLLGGNDSTPTRGVSLITTASPYYPRP